MSKVVTPYGQENSKKEQVSEMFDNIAPKYDFLNHLLSLGIDRGWRKKALKLLDEVAHNNLLDVATGTGDFALEAMKKLEPEQITGIDISQGMLDHGKQKIKKAKLEDRIKMIHADCEDLPFESNSFDAATVSFGVRNFENLSKGLKEVSRVLKPNGRFVILEFSRPKKWFRPIFQFYFRFILPTIGRLFSKDQRAYSYLPESVKVFPQGKEFASIFEESGFTEVKWKRLTAGVCTIYWGQKSS